MGKDKRHSIYLLIQPLGSAEIKSLFLKESWQQDKSTGVYWELSLKAPLAFHHCLLRTEKCDRESCKVSPSQANSFTSALRIPSEVLFRLIEEVMKNKEPQRHTKGSVWRNTDSQPWWKDSELLSTVQCHRGVGERKRRRAMSLGKWSIMQPVPSPAAEVSWFIIRIYKY